MQLLLFRWRLIFGTETFPDTFLQIKTPGTYIPEMFVISDGARRVAIHPSTRPRTSPPPPTTMRRDARRFPFSGSADARVRLPYKGRRRLSTVIKPNNTRG